MSEFSLKEIDDKNEWEAFNLGFSNASFLQSFNWGQFQKKINKKVFYFFVLKKDKVVGSFLLIKEEAKRGNYLTLAGGPTFDWQADNATNLFAYISREIMRIAKQEGCLFVRMRPQVLSSPNYNQLLAKNSWKKSPMHLTADLTLQLDLELSESEILAQMRKNTRYEIKKAQKLNIIVKKSQNLADIEEFVNFQNLLAKKHHFVPFDKLFLQAQFEVFSADDQALLLHSYHQDKLLASAFIIFYNQEAVYHYGISTPENDRLPGSYACQWQAILEAKIRGLKSYNFWGIAPSENKNHRFAGVSTFKRGFGGSEIQYMPAHDLPTNNLYYFVNFFESWRRRLRKL